MRYKLRILRYKHNFKIKIQNCDINTIARYKHNCDINSKLRDINSELRYKHIIVRYKQLRYKLRIVR